MKYRFCSHVGCLRNENQDNYLVLPEHSLFAVADGMGGHEGGALASSIAIKSFIDQANMFAEDTAEAIKKAHINIQKIARKNNPGKFEENHGMGTTGVVVCIENNEAIISWCGDSRIYKFANNKLYQISVDHSLVQELLDNGEISINSARNHIKKNVLTHAIGIGPLERLKIETKIIPLNPGDKLLLCTDGLTNELSDNQISKCMEMEVNASVDKLMEMSLDMGARDNVTVGIIEFE